jgi:hypothetical protein
MAGQAKVKEKASEVMRQQKEERVAQLEQEFGVKVDLSNVTMGDLIDMTSNDVPFEIRMTVIQKMLTEGEARNIKILDLERFMDLITTKLELQSNPTSGA